MSFLEKQYTYASMTVGRSISFAFKAPGAASKLAVGTLCSMLFFTGFFAFVLAGYLTRVLCNALEGRDVNLPTWKNLKELFIEGVEPVLILMVFFSPTILFLLAEWGLNATLGESVAVSIILAIPRILVAIGASIIFPVAMLRFVVKRSLSSAFEISHLLRFIRNNGSQYFKAWGLSIVLMILAVLCSIFFVVGLFFGTFVAYVIMVHLYAQTYRGGTPFKDDKESSIRSALTIPPPLNQ